MLAGVKSFVNYFCKKFHLRCLIPLWKLQGPPQHTRVWSDFVCFFPNRNQLCQLCLPPFFGTKAKGQISKRVLQENKVRQILRRTNISYPDTHTHVCVSGGKKFSYFGKFGVFYFLVTSVLRFVLFPYYQRNGYQRRIYNRLKNLR